MTALSTEFLIVATLFLLLAAYALYQALTLPREVVEELPPPPDEERL